MPTRDTEAISMSSGTTTVSNFEVRRDALGTTRVVSGTAPSPADGEVLLAIDSFALTANNITYAVTGDMIGYWNFFPPGDGSESGWGRIPVWGFADVVASAVDAVQPGARYYGYFPMGSHLMVTPTRVSVRGFTDGRAHRAALPAVYNQYQHCGTDLAYRADLEAMQLLFRPLFTTSFFLDDFLDDNGWFGARSVILSSASSKTALSLAWMLSRRGAERCRVVGLTSARNADFVRGLGCYDEVLSYDQIEQLPREPSVYVDMAGNTALRAGLHRHLAESLCYSCSVGATHWEDLKMGGSEDLPGPPPTLFFAPAQVEKRSEEWGAAGVAARSAAAWQPFVDFAQTWVKVRRGRGTDACEAIYRELLENRASPADGYVLSLRED
jgi:hypothetical protein